MNKRQKNVYLSIDLDYWYTPEMHNSINYISQLLELNRPVTVFTEHHLVLRDIKRQYKKVYNVDYHSDVTQLEPGWPTCGCWANFVYGRENSEFEWRMPNWKDCVSRGGGLCHRLYMESSRYNPFKNDDLHKWKNLIRKEGFNNIPLDDVDRISLVLSPEWSYGEFIEDTLYYLLDREREGQIKFFGRNVKPLIHRMIREGEPFYNWYKK